MRIGELAARTGLTVKTLRFYEQAGLVPAPARTPAGYRDYDETALPRLGFIRAAQAAGLTLAEVRQVILVRESSESPCDHVVALLDRHAAELDTRIHELRGARAEVERLRQRARDLDPASCEGTGVCHVIPPTGPSAEAVGPSTGRSSTGRSSPGPRCA